MVKEMVELKDGTLGTIVSPNKPILVLIVLRCTTKELQLDRSCAYDSAAYSTQIE